MSPGSQNEKIKRLEQEIAKADAKRVRLDQSIQLRKSKLNRLLSYSSKNETASALKAHGSRR